MASPECAKGLHIATEPKKPSSKHVKKSKKKKKKKEKHKDSSSREKSRRKKHKEANIDIAAAVKYLVASPIKSFCNVMEDRDGADKSNNRVSQIALLTSLYDAPMPPDIPTIPLPGEDLSLAPIQNDHGHTRAKTADIPLPDELHQKSDVSVTENISLPGTIECEMADDFQASPLSLPNRPVQVHIEPPKPVQRKIQIGIKISEQSVQRIIHGVSEPSLPVADFRAEEGEVDPGAEERLKENKYLYDSTDESLTNEQCNQLAHIYSTSSAEPESSGEIHSSDVSPERPQQRKRLSGDTRSSCKRRHRHRSRSGDKRPSYSGRTRSRSCSREKRRRRHRNSDERERQERHSRHRRRSDRRSRSRSASLGIDQEQQNAALHMDANNLSTRPSQKPDEWDSLKRNSMKSVSDYIELCKRVAQAPDHSDPPTNANPDAPPRPAAVAPPAKRPEIPPVINCKGARPTAAATESATQLASQLMLKFPVSSGAQHRPKELDATPVQQTELVRSGSETLRRPVQPHDRVFDADSSALAHSQLDISASVATRLEAMRQLQINPHDVVALGTLRRAQSELDKWASSKQLPGQFTGSTGVRCLSTRELDGGYAAIPTREMLLSAPKVSGGIGKRLLERMGWRDGEGLGKYKAGPAEPLLLDFKADRRGLESQQESSIKHIYQAPAQRKGTALVQTFEGKHPVCALMELAQKNHWNPPDFTLMDMGPMQAKSYIFKVRLNGVEYQPVMTCGNKKQAKAHAATVVLQGLGLLPAI